MQVYEGLIHFADVEELTRGDVDALQMSVKILALQKRDKTASFIEEYASHIIGSVQREAELIDSNDLEVFIAFPMLEGGALQIRFTGVNMDDLKYMQLHRALVLKIAGIAIRYYDKMGRDAHMAESIEFKRIAEVCEQLYEATEQEYKKHAYHGWEPNFAVRMKDYAKDPQLQILCWATESSFCNEAGLRGKTVRRQTVSGLDLQDVETVIDTLTAVMRDMVSSYSSKESALILESVDLGIIWLIKPESAEMDGSIHISKSNTLQIRYLVTDAVSSLGCYNCTRLSEYALGEAMDVVSEILACAQQEGGR